MSSNGREAKQQQKVLQHIERYRLTIPVVVAKLFFQPHLYPNRVAAIKKAETYLEGMVRSGVLARGECPAAKKGGKRPRYYLPKKAKPGPDAIGYDIACLWFCFFGSKRRSRLNREDLVSLLEDPPHKNIRFAIEDVRGIEGVKSAGLIVRLYPTGAEVKEVVRTVKRVVKESSKKYGPLLDSGDLSVAILFETSEKVRDAKLILSKKQPHDAPPLTREARLIVEVAPQADTLAAALASLKSRASNHG